MEIDKKKFLTKYLVGACLESFGIKNQFLELSFSSKDHDNIGFSVDCKITTNDQIINEKALYFKNIHSDVYEIIYFIKANLIEVKNYSFKDKIFSIFFANDYVISFHLNSEEESPLSISFRKIYTDKNYISLEFGNNGDFEIFEIAL